MSTSSDTLRVDIIGADQRALQTFQTAFLGPGRDRFSIVNATVAEALIVDLDGADALRQWRQYCQDFPDRPTLFIGQAPTDIPSDSRFLRKPLQMSALLSALDAIRAGIVAPAATTAATGDGSTQTQPLEQTEPDTAECTAPLAGEETTDLVAATPSPDLDADCIDILGVQADRDITALEADKDLRIPVNKRFLGIFQAALKQAIKGRQCMRLEYADCHLLIDPDTDSVSWQEDSGPYAMLCREPVDDNGLRVTSCDRDSATPTTHTETTTGMLWRLALWTYQGRLPTNTDLRNRVYLAHWPDLTRLLPIPNSTRIAALWTRQPMPLTFTAEALKIPQANVFAFYSANYTIGLSGQAVREADNLFQPGAMAS